MKIYHVYALCCAQLCPTLCSPIDCSQQVSSICENFQARILQGIVVSFSRGSSDLGIKPMSLALTGGFFTNEPSGKPKGCIWGMYMKFNNNLKWYTAAAKSLQSCRTLCDPIDSSHQAPPSLGFSRQEHWSGLQCRRPWLNSWVGKIPWRREQIPLQCSGLENSMDCIVHGVTKSQTQLSNFHFHFPSANLG